MMHVAYVLLLSFNDTIKLKIMGQNKKPPPSIKRGLGEKKNVVGVILVISSS
jgi:hypothetical protein